MLGPVHDFEVLSTIEVPVLNTHRLSQYTLSIFEERVGGINPKHPASYTLCSMCQWQSPVGALHM